MAPLPEPDPSASDADFTKAFQEVARGEKTASAMEYQLTALERKIEALLASMDEETERAPKAKIAQEQIKDGAGEK